MPETNGHNVGAGGTGAGNGAGGNGSGNGNGSGGTKVATLVAGAKAVQARAVEEFKETIKAP